MPKYKTINISVLLISLNFFFITILFIYSNFITCKPIVMCRLIIQSNSFHYSSVFLDSDLCKELILIRFFQHLFLPNKSLQIFYSHNLFADFIFRSFFLIIIVLLKSTIFYEVSLYNAIFNNDSIYLFCKIFYENLESLNYLLNQIIHVFILLIMLIPICEFRHHILGCCYIGVQVYIIIFP